VAINRGREITKIATTEWAKTVEERGAGELFINSIDHDGNRKGYNLELLRQISSSCSIPIIAMGGVFTWEHLAEGISKAHVDAVAAANIFHYTEHSTKKAKRFLLEQGLPLRKLA
jgi:cyclase